MALLGSRISVTNVLAPSAAATVGSMAHSLPTTPDRWGFSCVSNNGTISGAVAIGFSIFSANATRLFYRCSSNHNVRRNLRIWAEAIHSINR